MDPLLGQHQHQPQQRRRVGVDVAKKDNVDWRVSEMMLFQEGIIT